MHRANLLHQQDPQVSTLGSIRFPRGLGRHGFLLLHVLDDPAGEPGDAVRDFLAVLVGQRLGFRQELPGGLPRLEAEEFLAGEDETLFHDALHVMRTSLYASQNANLVCPTGNAQRFPSDSQGIRALPNPVVVTHGVLAPRNLPIERAEFQVGADVQNTMQFILVHVLSSLRPMRIL